MDMEETGENSSAARPTGAFNSGAASGARTSERTDGHTPASTSQTPSPSRPEDAQALVGMASVPRSDSARRRAAVLEAPLTRLSVGMWASRRHRACQLLLLPEEQQLVVLCDRRTTQPVRSPARFSLAVGSLAAKSPFASGHTAFRAAGCCHAFEVPFASIRGIDYSNPLCHEARLVLEVGGLRKREFPSLEAAREYFLEHAGRSQRGGASAANGGALRSGSHSSSGLLHAALQAQAAAGAAAAAAPAGWPVEAAAAPEARVAAERAGLDESELGPDASPAGGSAAPGDGQGQVLQRSSSGGGTTRTSLLLRLNSSAAEPQPAAAASPSKSPPSKSPPGSSGAGAAGWHDAGGQPASARCSVDSSYESDPGSPASGSLWYWGGTPADSCYLDAAPAVDSGGPSSSALRSGRRGAGFRGSSDSYGSWEDLAASTSSAGNLPASAPILAPAGSRLRFSEHHQRSPRTQPSSMVRAGSAPTPSFLSSPLRKGQNSQALAGGDGKPAGPSTCAASTPGISRATSEGHLLHASSPGKGAGQASNHPGRAADKAWPSAHAFTTVSRVYNYRTIVLNWTDPRLPGMLRPIIQGNEHLLRLHESGLPAWAIYAPQYGLFYRPWLRTLTWLFFYAWAMFSFAVGFYDLYKSIPGLQIVMQRLMSSVWLPPAAVLEWLEQHTQIRLSILLTYLFGKSEAFVWFMRWSQHAARVAQAALKPVADVLGPPAALLQQAFSAVWLTVAAILQAGLAPLAAVLLECWAALGSALLPVVQLLQSVVTGPFVLLAGGLRQLGAASGALWAVVSQAGAGVASSAAALAGTAKAGRAVGGATSQAIADQALWLYIIPADALEALRTTAVKAAKAAQAVAKFCLQICDNVVRHRLTLGLRAQRAWRRVRAWLAAVAAAPRRLVQALLGWLLMVFRALVVRLVPDTAAAAGAAPQAGGGFGSAPAAVQANPQPGQQQQQQQQQQWRPDSMEGECSGSSAGHLGDGLRRRGGVEGRCTQDGSSESALTAPAIASSSEDGRCKDD